MRFMYHASPVEGLKILEPRASEGEEPRVYFSEKRENTLVYLCNAVEKFCRESGCTFSGIREKWGPHGFTAENKFQFQEYYPNALRESYKGVSAFIYKVRDDDCIEMLEDTPHGFYSKEAVKVIDCEVIADAYDEIMKAYEEGKIDILRYEDRTIKQSVGNNKKIQKEYNDPNIRADYKCFLECKFPWLKW